MKMSRPRILGEPGFSRRGEPRVHKPPSRRASAHRRRRDRPARRHGRHHDQRRAGATDHIGRVERQASRLVVPQAVLRQRQLRRAHGRPPGRHLQRRRQGLASGATKTGKYDSTSRAARAYREFLTDRQNAAASSVGAGPYYHYTTALNGFAAKLTGPPGHQLLASRRRAGRRPRQDAATPTPPTPRRSSASPARPACGVASAAPTRSTGAGNGIIVGIIDSRHQRRVVDGLRQRRRRRPRRLARHLRPPATDDTFACNDKLIGGRYFDEAAQRRDPRESSSLLTTSTATARTWPPPPRATTASSR